MRPHRRIFQYDEILAYKFIPELKARIPHEGGGYLLETNNLGFRSHHKFLKKKQKDKKRVLIFGDSFTAGDGVSNKDRFTDILESIMPNVEIYNFAISGSGTDQQYLTWDHYAKEFEYDLIIMSIQVQNINRNTARYRQYLDEKGNRVVMQKPYFEINENDKLELKNIPVPKGFLPVDSFTVDEMDLFDISNKFIIARKLINKFIPNSKEFIKRLIKFQPQTDYDNPYSKGWLLMKKILELWISKINKPIILFPIPTYEYIEEISSSKNYQKRFVSFCEEMNITLCDPLNAFKGYSMKERRNFRFKSDTHMTPLAQKILADSLLIKIQSSLK